MNTIAVIASVTPTGIYRVKNRSPWPKLKREADAVQTLTRGHVVIADPVTHTLLPDNINPSLHIVVNHSAVFLSEDCRKYPICQSMSESIELATKIKPGKNIFFLGDEKLLLQATQICTDMHIMEVDYDARMQDECLSPIDFFHKAISPSRSWMIENIQTYVEIITDAALHISLKYTHYRRVGPVSQD